MPPVWVDLRRFEEGERCAAQALRAGLVAEAGDAVRAALALWRGPALHGIPGRVRGVPVGPAGRAGAGRAGTPDRPGSRRGSYSALVGEPRELLAEHPLHQGLTRRPMLALYGAGGPADALAAYRAARQPHGTATVLSGLGRGQVPAGPPHRARRSLVRAPALVTELGAPHAAGVRTRLERLDRFARSATP